MEPSESLGAVLRRIAPLTRGADHGGPDGVRLLGWNAESVGGRPVIPAPDSRGDLQPPSPPSSAKLGSAPVGAIRSGRVNTSGVRAFRPSEVSGHRLDAEGLQSGPACVEVRFQRVAQTRLPRCMDMLRDAVKRLLLRIHGDEDQ